MAIYQGETIPIKVIFKDDDGELLTDLNDYTIDVVVYNKLYGNQELHYSGTDLVINETTATLQLKIPAEDSATLIGDTVIEIRFIGTNAVVIGQTKAVFYVKQTKIKRY